MKIIITPAQSHLFGRYTDPPGFPIEHDSGAIPPRVGETMWLRNPSSGAMDPWSVSSTEYWPNSHSSWLCVKVIPYHESERERQPTEAATDNKGRV